MLTAFISYGTPDEVFASQLNDVLIEAGIKTFFFPVNAEPGVKLHHLMRDGVNSYDKMIFICSESSLNRFGLLNELEEVLQREAREGGKQILIPISLDDYIFKCWEPTISGLKQTILDRVIANFIGAKNNKLKFTTASNKIIRALGGKVDITYLSYKNQLLLNKLGTNVISRLQRNFIVHKQVKEIVYGGINGVGAIKPISTNFGKIVKSDISIGTTSIHIKMADYLPIDEIINHKLEVEFTNGFTQENESYSYQSVYACEKVRIEIIFPEERPFKTANLRCISNGVSNNLNGLKKNKKKNLLSLDLVKPDKGSLYYINWSW